MDERQAIMLAATAIAIGLCEGRSEEDILALSALFDVIGDQMALYTAITPAPSPRPDPPISRPA